MVSHPKVEYKHTKALQWWSMSIVNILEKIDPVKTRTTRTPAFWGYPPLPHDYPYYWPVHIGFKTRQSQSYKSKEFAKTSNFKILKKNWHATHLLKLHNKMCKYEIDLASIVEDIERTRFCPQTDRRTDRQTDRQTEGKQGETSTPPSTSLRGVGVGDYKTILHHLSTYFWVEHMTSGGRFKNAYELLTLRALKISMFHKRFIFQCMGKIFCVEFQRYPLKLHTKYLTHTLKDITFIQHWNFKSS